MKPKVHARPAGVSRLNVANRLEKRSLLIAINCLAGLSILFFGYDQGMMGGVNTAPNYVQTVGIGYTTFEGDLAAVQITDTLLQGGIVSIYYLGALCGALFGGWIGDKVGRIRSIAIGAAIGLVGAALQTSAMSATWMILARLVNGFGTGILNAIIPVFAAETAEHTSRGQFIAIEFTLNIFGVVLAYWIEYGLSYIDQGLSQIRWRFPIGFQIILLLGLLAMVFFFPESPRYLVKAGKEEEARWVLGRLRGDTDPADIAKADAEFNEIKAVQVESEKSACATSYLSMISGRGSGKLHVGRRVQLVIWLQIIQEWVGIAGVTIYAPTIFRLAGFDARKAQWISGLNTITYMFSTLICVFTLDRIGRRWTLFWGSAVQGIAMFLCGGLVYLTISATAAGNADAANKYGAAAASMVFLFTAVFGATWLTVPWLYPAEIFPLAVRARGNALGVVGWCIGNGWLTLLLPVCFANIEEKTFYLFGIANAISIPIVYCFYPESNQRTLEEMDLLFSADKPWNWSAEAEFARLKKERPDIVHEAAQGRVNSNETVRVDEEMPKAKA